MKPFVWQIGRVKRIGYYTIEGKFTRGKMRENVQYEVHWDEVVRCSNLLGVS